MEKIISNYRILLLKWKVKIVFYFFWWYYSSFKM